MEKLEVLNYENDKHRFIKSSVSLGDMYTTIKEVIWDINDKIEEINIKNMKFVNALFPVKERAKLQSKKNYNEDAEIIRVIFGLIPKPKENQFKCNIKFEEDPKSLRIDYYCLNSIVIIIMYILENIIRKTEFPQLLNEVFNNNFKDIMDIGIWGSSLMKFKDAFNKIENLTFSLTGSHDDNISLNDTLLFYYFFPVLFPKVKCVTINLNQSKINNIYNIDKNPYKIKEADIIDFCLKFQNLFISNYIISDLISNLDTLCALRIIMSESFINEINYIFNKEFGGSKIFKEMIGKKISLIYFRKFMLKRLIPIPKLSLAVNSLDVFLFKEVINLIVMHRGSEQLELQLFSEPKFFNLRKIYLNYLTSQEDEINPNIAEKYQIIMYPYIDSLDENILQLIEEEKIPDLLFPKFKKNINKLKLILSESVNNFKNFYLDISPYEELCKYDNYNIEILLFIYAIISALEKSKTIKILELICLNINYISVQQIRKKINNLIDGKSIDLSGCNQLESLTLNMTGISLFLDFNKLPTNSLKKLIVDISTVKDMKALNEGLKNQQSDLQNLLEIKLNLCLTDSDKLFEEFLRIYENLPYNLECFKLSIENSIGKLDLIKIMKGILKNINLTKEKNIFYSLNCNSKELEIYLYNNRIYALKEFFINNNAFFVEKCSYNDQQIRKINISLIKWPELDIISTILLSFNKIANKTEIKNNQKIFSKIFSFMGKSQEFVVNLN